MLPLRICISILFLLCHRRKFNFHRSRLAFYTYIYSLLCECKTNYVKSDTIVIPFHSSCCQWRRCKDPISIECKQALNGCRRVPFFLVRFDSNARESAIIFFYCTHNLRAEYFDFFIVVNGECFRKW